MSQSARVQVSLIRGGASSPAAGFDAKVIQVPGNGDCLFIALAYARVACKLGKAWPTSDEGQIRYGAALRTWYLRWLQELLLDADFRFDGLSVRELILGSSDCSTIDEYMEFMKVPTMDSRSWGGWAEILSLAAKWKIQLAVFWKQGQQKAQLRGLTRRVEPLVRAAVLYNVGGHYDALSLSAPAWAAVDAATAAEGAPV